VRHFHVMIIEKLTVGPIQENCYIVGDEQSGEGFIIDPGYEADRIVAKVRELNLKVDKIINTHAHVDHVCAVQPIKKQLGATFYMHPHERFHFENLVEHASMFGMPNVQVPTIDVELSDGDTIDCGLLSVRVIFTPGHAPGHCMLAVGEDFFCGDLVFAGSIGRTDLPGCDHNDMIKSLEEAILPLPDSTRLHPGHGESTTMAVERKYNPFLQGLMART